MKNKNKKYLTKRRKTKILKLKVGTLILVLAIASTAILYTKHKVLSEIGNITNLEQVIRIEPKQTPIEITEVISGTIREVTAYNVGDPAQCDSTPCIGAYSKVNLCEEVAKGTNVCASNFVPLGTKLLIEAENGWNMECIVWDRMAKRFSNRVDIAMNLWEKDRAVNFGKQRLSVKILGESKIIN